MLYPDPSTEALPWDNTAPNLLYFSLAFTLLHRALRLHLHIVLHTYQYFTKRAMRIIAPAARTAKSSPIFRELNIMPFSRARDYKTAVLVKRLICTNTPYHSSILSFPSRNTRHANDNKLNLPKISYAYGPRSLPFTGMKIWNSLPPAIKCTAQNEQSIKTYIMSDTYSSPSWNFVMLHIIVRIFLRYLV